MGTPESSVAAEGDRQHTDDQPRRPYSPPELRRYGTVVKLTRRTGTNANALRDKAGGGVNKTR